MATHCANPPKLPSHQSILQSLCSLEVRTWPLKSSSDDVKSLTVRRWAPEKGQWQLRWVCTVWDILFAWNSRVCCFSVTGEPPCHQHLVQKL